MLTSVGIGIAVTSRAGQQSTETLYHKNSE